MLFPDSITGNQIFYKVIDLEELYTNLLKFTSRVTLYAGTYNLECFFIIYSIFN